MFSCIRYRGSAVVEHKSILNFLWKYPLWGSLNPKLVCKSLDSSNVLNTESILTKFTPNMCFGATSHMHKHILKNVLNPTLFGHSKLKIEF